MLHNLPPSPVVYHQTRRWIAADVFAAILDRMTEDDWSRQGTHGESGVSSVMDWLGAYAVHAHDHVDQIRRARAAGSDRTAHS